MADPIVTLGEASSHWYDANGQPCHTVLDNKGQPRATTLRDARKLGLVPSVTTIMQCANKPGLNRWREEQVLLAALTLPRNTGEPEREWVRRVVEDSRETARKAAERGTAIHAAVEQAYRWDTGYGYTEHVAGVMAAVEQLTGLLPAAMTPERTFARQGYGGTVDLSAPGWVLDVKTKEFTFSDPRPQLWDEHCMQLAAYAFGLDMAARCAIVFVSSTEPGLVVMQELTTEQRGRGLEMFSALKAYWQAANNYYPGA